jgi:hypothetical protein
LAGLFILQEFFQNQKVEWQIIESKAKSFLKKNYPDLDLMSELAKFKQLV